ncbi:hypothetical protein D0Z08_06810 [Nocardioides immobilis]|uniref:Gram-positive cocci surface proteins LPxTG domain-containing protein n=1 Tax=Nocardioides immobilis TaxID=2049295 RepID=A0A417Y668_9ACTN|nr:hypothetical protein [Nocardioides immobilis]RHW27984.1 hypothetical protein D0Z08_06810 [Nocardioides immobilis]
MIRTTLSAATAVLVAAVAGVVVPAGEATAFAAAPACSGDTGVTVIVDFNELGGGVTAACDPDGAGKSASEVFDDTGYPLVFAQQDPGFVCRVSGKPADSPCVRTPPATAYWSLWWSDGESGRWSYATSGVNVLEVPDGGFVAFAWHQGQDNAAPPDASPTRSDPEPTDDGGNGGNDGNGGGNNNGGGGQSDDGGGQSTAGTVTTSAPTDTSEATASPTDAKSPGEGKKRRDRERDDPSASATSSSAVPGAGEITAGPPESDLGTDASADDGGALPTWIGLGLAVLVLGAAALVTLLRRRPE